MILRTGLAFLLSISALAAETTSPALLILSKSDQTLSIVDGKTLKVGARLPSGPDPHEVVASTDGHYAFISNYGGGAYNTISVIDLVAQKALPAVDLSPLRGPHGLDFYGGKLWFTAEINQVIGSLDPATMKVDFILGTGQNRTHMVYVLPDGKRMVTTNVNAGRFPSSTKRWRRRAGARAVRLRVVRLRVDAVLVVLRHRAGLRVDREDAVLVVRAKTGMRRS